ncbi:hypothetical protein SanaruYs_27810 [Chryseotalea sanaruensis]|jgi:hypothetical protein|uniref:Uncharacterized protein n=1 Tax=Chryseotalea sanaruensis TaxID=2482724 RepID=A0A401UCD4_9BACT|nr:hypothetical protein [Chryseotalea sanaruensis]GCC52544.1 hypothetical protein SanaruYs_27810 [Chryseotalea sanaruensis]
MAKSEKSSSKKKPKVHKELEGFEMSINSFGEINSSLDIEKLNAFLDKNVDDKKLAERDDYEEIKKPKTKKKK